jgi:hypothetical protein
VSIFASGHDDARIVVHRPRPDAAGRRSRKVDFLGLEVGHAYDLQDVKTFMARCGMDPALVDQPGVIEWLGGGQDVWE